MTARVGANPKIRVSLAPDPATSATTDLAGSRRSSVANRPIRGAGGRKRGRGDLPHGTRHHVFGPREPRCNGKREVRTKDWLIYITDVSYKVVEGRRQGSTHRKEIRRECRQLADGPISSRYQGKIARPQCSTLGIGPPHSSRTTDAQGGSATSTADIVMANEVVGFGNSNVADDVSSVESVLR